VCTFHSTGTQGIHHLLPRHLLRRLAAPTAPRAAAATPPFSAAAAAETLKRPEEAETASWPSQSLLISLAGTKARIIA